MLVAKFKPSLSILRAEEQEWSAHTTELADMEAASAVDEKHLSRDKRWILFVCQEQLIQQRVINLDLP